MKIKCVRCGAKSTMALCPACLPADVAAQSVPASSFRKSLPARSELKGGIADAADESKQLFTQARTWSKGNFKRYAKFKNWNIAFEKSGLIALAKDTALAVLPLIVIGFISAKLLLSQVSTSDYLPSGALAQAAAFWILNFALGIGITLSGDASVSIFSVSAGGTARLLASGLTILITYLLIRKSRARATAGSFTLNAQSEIVGTAAVLSTISFALTSLTANAVSGGADVGGLPVSGSLSVTVDFYSLFIGPLIISAISVLLGSYAVKSQKKISDALNQSVAFLLGATAVVSVVVILVALKEREITFIPLYLAIAPTVVLAVLVGASGVPLINIGGDSISLSSSSSGTPIDITHPTLSLVLYFGLLLLGLMLIGIVMGFRVDPRTFTARSSTRIILTITGLVLFLNFFFMFYAFGSASAVFGAASGSDSMAVFAHPLYLIPASLMWGAVYVFGARYLTPWAAEIAPSLVSKVIPKLRISISDYYLQTPVAAEELTPLQKQTKTMQVAKAKSLTKKVVLVVAAFFIITGPANNFVANKLSSPTSAVSGFFDSLQSSNAASALSHINISNDEISQVLLTDQVLSNYLHKPKVTAIEVLESDGNYATVEVAYTLNGLSRTATLNIVKDSENKLYKLFPVWKISQEVLREVETYSYDGKSVTISGASVPTETSKILLFPGVVGYNYEDPIYTKNFDITLPVESYMQSIFELRDASYKTDAESYIEKLARRSITECNSMTENPQSTCPYYQEVRTTTLQSVENFTVTNIRESNSGHVFTLDFDFVSNYTNPSTGVIQKTKYHFNRTTYLDKQDSFQTIVWGY
jgi:hypothetical protein